MIELFNSAPQGMSFSMDVHAVSRDELPKEVRYATPHGLSGGVKIDTNIIRYDGGNEDSGNNISFFMKKED